MFSVVLALLYFSSFHSISSSRVPLLIFSHKRPFPTRSTPSPYSFPSPFPFPFPVSSSSLSFPSIVFSPLTTFPSSTPSLLPSLSPSLPLPFPYRFPLSPFPHSLPSLSLPFHSTVLSTTNLLTPFLPLLHHLCLFLPHPSSLPLPFLFICSLLPANLLSSRCLFPSPLSHSKPREPSASRKPQHKPLFIVRITDNKPQEDPVRRLTNSAHTLLLILYDRDCRRAFTQPGHWLGKYVVRNT